MSSRRCWPLLYFETTCLCRRGVKGYFGKGVHRCILRVGSERVGCSIYIRDIGGSHDVVTGSDLVRSRYKPRYFEITWNQRPPNVLSTSTSQLQLLSTSWFRLLLKPSLPVEIESHTLSESCCLNARYISTSRLLRPVPGLRGLRLSVSTKAIFGGSNFDLG